MNKLFLLAVLACMAVTVNAQQSGNLYLDSNFDGDHPEAAMNQEFRLTRDPLLGAVPKERLLPVMDYITQQFASNSAPLVSNWVERGPNNVGGRTRAIMFDPNDATNKKVWAGAVDGGLWVTNDITVASPVWTSVNSFWANMAVTSIAYTPSNHQVFYAGTGEGFGNADAVRGLGIWKTTDGGTTWNQLAATNNNSNFDYVQKIVVHPTTGAVFAATRSHYCNNGGLFRSLDGGATWTSVLGTNTGVCATSNTYAADVEIGADGTMYASMGIFYTGGIYKSIDAGSTWTSIGGNGFPTTGFQRIEIATAPSDANRIYAMVASSAANGSMLGIYTSANKGATWTTCTMPAWFDQSCASSSSDMTRGQSWYDLILAVDPLNASTVLAGGVDIMRTTNAGSSWTQLTNWIGNCGRPAVHADQHAIMYQPGSSSIGVFGNDGGIYYSSNLTLASPTFSSKNTGYNVTQFYSCAIHPGCGVNYFLAGAQDNGTHKFSSAGMNSTVNVNGGDGAFCFIDQTNPTYQIASYVYNNYYRTNDNWATSTQILSSVTDGSIGDFINPADYDDANHILYSAYSTTQLTRVSGVTNPTPNAGVQLTVTGMSGMPTHIRVSPYGPAGTTTLFVGTDNGQLFKVTNAQGSPTSTNISGSGSPWSISTSISCVEIGATENDLLVTFSNYGVISVWRTTDGGTTWANKEGNLPDMPVRWAIYNPNNLSEVFLATELGVWSTTDITVASPVWAANNNGLANVRVDMFQMRSSDKTLIAATHGRGLFSSTVFGPGSPPASDFTANVTTVCAGNPITFSDASCSSPTSWSWTFTGGTPSSSTLQNPVITYAAAGTYAVTLTATNANGSSTKTKTNYIIINPSPSLSSSLTQSRCSNVSTTYTATSATVGATFSWTRAVVAGISNALGSGSGAAITETLINTSTSPVNVIYAITLTANGCSQTQNVTVTVNPTPTVGTTATSTTLCTGTSTSMTGTGAVSYIWQPGGFSGVTYTVTPASTTTYTVTGTNANGCINTATRLITVNSCGTTVNLKLFLEGYYIGASTMLPVLMNQGVGGNATVADSIDVLLRSSVSPFTVINSVRTILNTNGTAVCNFIAGTGNYYIEVVHRNAIQTWSKLPLAFTGVPFTYDFTTAADKAYGNNMIQVSTGVWAFFSGDLNADENVDLLDMTSLETAIDNFVYGYYATDLNGDGNVDLLDTPVIEDNINNFIFSNHP